MECEDVGTVIMLTGLPTAPGRAAALTMMTPMANLNVSHHVAGKIVTHQGGAISGVAAVYQRHEFMRERKQALEAWGRHVASLLGRASFFGETQVIDFARVSRRSR